MRGAFSNVAFQQFVRNVLLNNTEYPEWILRVLFKLFLQRPEHGCCRLFGQGTFLNTVHDPLEIRFLVFGILPKVSYGFKNLKHLHGAVPAAALSSGLQIFFSSCTREGLFVLFKSMIKVVRQFFTRYLGIGFELSCRAHKVNFLGFAISNQEKLLELSLSEIG